MSTSKLWRWALPALILVAGTLLLSQAGVLAPETTLGRTARLNALAPSTDRPDAATAAPERVSDVTPVTVWLADVPSSDDRPGQYQRWLAGEIDLDEPYAFLTPDERRIAQAAAMTLAPDDGVQLLETVRTLQGIGFESLDFRDHPMATAVPPDPDLAAGPNHLIAVANSIFEIYAKDGSSIVGPLALADFFASVGEPACIARGIGPFDPTVLYDESADRYIITADGNGTHYCVAVSVTGDAAGAYYQYAFPTNVGGNFFDYPHVGVGRDALYMGANLFDLNIPAFAESRVWAFDKAAMYAGLPASAASHSLGSSFSTPQPAKLHGFAQGTWPTSGPHYTLAKLNNNNFSLFAWNDPFGADSFTNQATFDLTAATGVFPGFPVDVPQQGGNALTANDIRLLDTEYRNGSLWTAMSISCNPGGGTVNCIRWAEINPSASAIVQAGVFASPGAYVTFPDVAVDRFGNMAVGYTKSNSAMFPSVWAACRDATAPAGTMGPETALKAGETTYISYDSPPFRWGDYTGMTIDPDGETFWYLGQYSKMIDGPARWGTYVSGFTAAECLPSAPTDFLYAPLVIKP